MVLKIWNKKNYILLVLSPTSSVTFEDHSTKSERNDRKRCKQCVFISPRDSILIYLSHYTSPIPSNPPAKSSTKTTKIVITIRVSLPIRNAAHVPPARSLSLFYSAFRCRSCVWRQYARCPAAVAYRYLHREAIGPRSGSSSPRRRSCCPLPKFSPTVSHQKHKELQLRQPFRVELIDRGWEMERWKIIRHRWVMLCLSVQDRGEQNNTY